MSTVTGNVDRIYDNEKAYNLQVDGEWYGYGFKSDGAPSFTEGQTISFDYEQRGKYKNIDKKTIKVVESSGGGAAAPNTRSNSADNRQLSIQYQSSRNAAIQLVGVMLDAGAVAIPAKKADQFDAIVALVDDLTVKFHSDVDQTVEDGGVTPAGFDVPAEKGEGF